ncbi:MAG TPA: hypothetical protein PKA32_03215 [Candidatus Gracilibacteria bacterium]|nr:hypothetical protein [Candidatus Gracilibacteria bacterium]
MSIFLKDEAKNKEALNKDEQENAAHMDKFAKKRIQAHLNIVLISALVAGIAALIGYGIDSVMGTRPIAIIAAVLLSFPLAQFVIIKRLRSL